MTDRATPPPARTLPPWRRFVALGDSFTEGLSDLGPDGTYRGWADRLAERIAEQSDPRSGAAAFGYANLAVRGRQLRAIVQDQVPAALALDADLVSLVGGGNDILRPGADLDALATQLEHGVQRLRASGADVLLATPVDPTASSVLRLTRGRFGVHAANIWSIAGRHGAVVLDLWGLRSLRDPRMWAPDRIHLTSAGHRRVAAAAAHVLGLDDAVTDALPAALPDGTVAPRQTWRQDVVWARQHAAPWVGRRLRGRSSGDRVQPKRPTATPLDRPAAPGPSAD